MSDIIVVMGGHSIHVERPFREDSSHEKFILREYIELRRVTDNERSSAFVERIRPGMFVYGLIDELHDVSYAECRQQLDRLPVFYVLEFVQKESARANADSSVLASDDAEAFILPCKPLSHLRGPPFSHAGPTVNASDLIVGDQPFYMPIDSIVTRMAAVIGVGAATPSFDAPRRVSHFAHVDEDFRVENGSALYPLLNSSEVLQPTFSDALPFFDGEGAAAGAAAAASHAVAYAVAAAAAARPRAKSLTSGWRDKRSLAHAAPTAFDGALPVKRKPGRPRKRFPPPPPATKTTSTTATTTTTTTTTVKTAPDSLDGLAQLAELRRSMRNEELQAAAAASAPSDASMLPTLVSLLPGRPQSPIVEPTVPTGKVDTKPLALQVRPTSLQHILSDNNDVNSTNGLSTMSNKNNNSNSSNNNNNSNNNSNNSNINFTDVDADPVAVDALCTLPLDPVDLSKNTWHKFEPQLMQLIAHLLAAPSRDEQTFRSSARVREFFTHLTRARLGGEFGTFVDNGVFQNSELAALFLSRFHDEHIFLAHTVMMRPLVYRKLCALALADGLTPLADDNPIVAMARALRKRNEAQISNSH